MAEDFFLRFGALVNTINVNKSAVAQAAKAIQGALNQKAAVEVAPKEAETKDEEESCIRG